MRKIFKMVVLSTIMLSAGLIYGQKQKPRQLHLFNPPVQAYVNAAKENLRKSPNGEKIGVLLRGAKLEKLAETGDWAEVRVTGWIWIPSISEEKINQKGTSPSKPKETFQEAKKQFEEWAWKNYAITYFHYESDWQIWLKLKPEKYTNKKNVEAIAETIARHYRLQTGFTKLVIVTVWDHRGNIYAKGIVQ